MNRIILIGRLVRDVEKKTTATGKTFANFTVAVRKKIKPTNPDEKDSDFFNCKVWGQSAEYAAGYLAKGSLVSLEGRMESRKYTDKEGQNREVWEVNADQVNGLDRKATGDAPSRTSAPAPQPIQGGQDDFDPFE
jgi:single-strand DNA-binding protein